MATAPTPALRGEIGAWQAAGSIGVYQGDPVAADGTVPGADDGLGGSPGFAAGNQSMRIRGYASRASGTDSVAFAYYEDGRDDVMHPLLDSSSITVESIVVQAGAGVSGWVYYGGGAAADTLVEERRLMPFGSGVTVYTPAHPILVPHGDLERYIRLWSADAGPVSSTFSGRLTPGVSG